MKVSFIGIGNVGFAIANNLHKKGYRIIIANNNPRSESVRRTLERNPLLSQALHLEHMTLLWVKMVRMNGHSPNFAWACLEK